MGKIDLKNTDEKHQMIYSNDWNCKTLKAHSYGKPLNIKEITEILNNIPQKATLGDYFDRFSTQNGIGYVYIITLRYFATKAEHPIYDRFSHSALKAITWDMSDGIGLWIDKPNVNSDLLRDNKNQMDLIEGIVRNNSFRPIFNVPNVSTYSKTNMEKTYDKYENLIKELFPNIYKDRKVDRALWVYGHYFSK